MLQTGYGEVALNARQSTYFDVRVFNPHAASNRQTNPSICYRKHENVKSNPRNRALFLYTTRDVINRRPWPRFNIHLQAPCHPPGGKMGPTLHLYNELAEMPPLILTPKILNSSHQRSPFNCRQGLKSNLSSNRSSDQ